MGMVRDLILESEKLILPLVQVSIMLEGNSTDIKQVLVKNKRRQKSKRHMLLAPDLTIYLELLETFPNTYYSPNRLFIQR